jgi:hypothetical protein
MGFWVLGFEEALALWPKSAFLPADGVPEPPSVASPRCLWEMQVLRPTESESILMKPSRWLWCTHILTCPGLIKASCVLGLGFPQLMPLQTSLSSLPGPEGLRNERGTHIHLGCRRRDASQWRRYLSQCKTNIFILFFWDWVSLCSPA